MSDERHTSEAIDLLVALIRNACVNTGDPTSGNEIRSVRTVQEYLGMKGTVVEPVPGRASVVYRLKGFDPSAPALLMIPHLDVVPADDAEWTHDPFGAVRADGFIWGRGAVDMLNLTSAMVVVFKWLTVGLMAQPPGDIILACVADEEAGGVFGARNLVDNHWDLVTCDYVLTEVAGPTLTTSDGVALPVTVAEKGPMWRKATTTGTPGHGSQPYGRDNAVETLGRAIVKIAGSDQPVRVTEQWLLFVDYLGLDSDVTKMLKDPDSVDSAIETVSEYDIALARWIHACTHMTLSTNVVEGGTKINMIPDTAHADIDIRLLPGQDASDVDDHLRKVLGPDLFDEITFVPVLDMTANQSVTSGRLWNAIGAAAEHHLGTSRLAPTLTPVTTDARFFRERGIPSYGVGLFDDTATFSQMLAMFHGIDERVSEVSVQRTTEFLATVIEAFGSQRGES